MTGAEIVALTKVSTEAEHALAELATVTGADTVLKEATGGIADALHYRREVRRVRLVMSAVEKIKAMGAPAHAVSDPILRAVLEDGALTDDPTLQEMWENLLVSDAVSDAVSPAFPGILRDLGPAEARALNELHTTMGDPRRIIRMRNGAVLAQEGGAGASGGGTPVSLTAAQEGNLDRLGLVALANDPRGGMILSPLGVEFVAACQPRSPAES